MKTRIHALTLVAAAAWLATVMEVTGAGLGDPAAPLSISEWVKGKSFSLAGVKGQKVVVVEFWATWCGPCRTSGSAAGAAPLPQGQDAAAAWVARLVPGSG